VEKKSAVSTIFAHKWNFSDSERSDEERIGFKTIVFLFLCAHFRVVAKTGDRLGTALY